MAEKRMFSKQVISSDAFLDMPTTSQVLYFHLSMMADDDGFVDSPRSVMRSIGVTKEDMDMLIKNKYIIYFQDEGVSVIRHWNISNNIRSDRYKETKYKELKNRLSLDEDGSYNILEQNQPGAEPQPNDNQPGAEPQPNDNQPGAEPQPNDNQPGAEPQPNDTIDQVSIDQDRSDKNNLDQKKEKPKNKKQKSAKNIGLLDREPKNDIERVNKKWLENYIAIFGNQPISPRWDLSTPLVSKALKQAGLEKVLQALETARQDKFCLEAGYILKTIMSGNVLSRLINAKPTGTGPPPSLKDKKSLEGLDSWQTQ
jgi:hypothetical protein